MKTALVRIMAVVLVIFCFGCSGNRTNAADANSCMMFAHFINVGQADTTLLEFPCGAILIDAGAQDSGYEVNLIEYLTKFFKERPDLNNTLESVFITHDHEDHTKALRKICENFKVKRLIDNGNTNGRSPKWVKTNYKGVMVEEIDNDDVTATGNKKGITDSNIDPINCKECDPKIAILWSRSLENPGWGDGEDNKNNESLVIRVDFGKASFLFTGDAEEPETDAMLDYYNAGSDDSPVILDVDVYHVGHHGSQNGTTQALVDAMTPKIAVISVGQWNNEITSSYGHPRAAALDLLNQDKSMKNRSPSVKIMAADENKKFALYTIRKKIYTTASDGNIKIEAKWDGSFKVTGNN